MSSELDRRVRKLFNPCSPKRRGLKEILASLDFEYTEREVVTYLDSKLYKRERGTRAEMYTGEILVEYYYTIPVCDHEDCRISRVHES